MTKPDTSIRRRKLREARWHKYANCISELLGWPHCTGMPWEYIVCDTRTKTGGYLEMVHIDGHSTKSIRKQVADIIRSRK